MVKKFFFPLVAFTLLSCNNLLLEKEDVNKRTVDFKDINYTSEASRIIGDLFNLQIETCEKAIDTVSLYVDDSSSSRMLIKDVSDFTELGKRLPTDLSTLQRNVSKNCRSAEETTITLEEELNAIVEEYQSNLKKITPDHTKAATVEGINVSETGYLFGADAEIPFDSLQGIITTAVLNDVSDGKDIESVLSSIGNDMSQISFEEENDRAVYEKSTPLWPKGIVNYRWGEITDEHKELMKNAMKVWTDNTDVSFNELEENGWYNFTLAIKVRGCVVYNTAKLERGIAGNSNVGCIGGKQNLNLSETLQKNQYERTPIHELGHALGLQHEQARYDRDKWIEIPADKANDTVNYGIVPKEISGWRWESRTIRIGLWRITLYYPAFWTSEYSWQSDIFDFDSVMLYPGLRVKTEKIGQNKGYKYTDLNTQPSQLDFEMINKMY